MLKKIGIIFAVSIAALFVFAATRPDTFLVQRTTGIKAPPEKIFALINDFHSWTVWSPFEKLDPAMKRTYIGPESGKGAVYEWEGNSKAGKGRMEITDSTPPSKVIIKLDFDKPMEGHNIAEFTLDPTGDSSTVTWAMRGTYPFIGKLMSIFLSMDRMVGTEFETGLANLKAIAEK